MTINDTLTIYVWFLWVAMLALGFFLVLRSVRKFNTSIRTEIKQAENKQRLFDEFKTHAK